jgi:hypothetical protein
MLLADISDQAWLGLPRNARPRIHGIHHGEGDLRDGLRRIEIEFWCTYYFMIASCPPF